MSRPSHDAYTQLDLPLVCRISGALWIIGALYVAAFLALVPPTANVGPVGWTLTVLLIASALLVGGAVLAVGRPIPPGALLATAYLSVAEIAALQVVGGQDGPWTQLLFLVVVFNAAVHPPRRFAPVFALSVATALIPLAYGGGPAEIADVAGNVVLLCGLTLVTVWWTRRMIGMRSELDAHRRTAEELARVDVLTGLGNRRALDEALAAEREVVARTGRPLSLLVGDVDRFKAINDDIGHGAGDRVLADIATVLRDAVRRPDHCFRWGGDEFIVLLPDTPEEEAELVAGRVRDAVRDRLRRPDGEPLEVTLGAAELRDGEAGEQLVDRADSVLLALKGDARASAR